MDAQIKVWGNSQGIRLPKAMLDELNIGVDDYVNIEVKNGSIVINKRFKHKTLEERYADFVEEIEQIQEFDWGEPVGKEVW